MISEEVGVVWVNSRPYHECLTPNNVLLVCLCGLHDHKIGMTRALSIPFGSQILSRYDTIRKGVGWALGECGHFFLGARTPARMLTFVPYCVRPEDKIDYALLTRGLTRAFLCAIRGSWRVVIPTVGLAPGIDPDEFLECVYRAASSVEIQEKGETVSSITVHTSVVQTVE